MALQNRVSPTGEIITSPARGAWMGNRGGALHRPDRTLTKRRWVTKSWIICQLSFKDRHRTVMSPGRYTELFFLDEATAYAAGHRPCAECRRAEFDRFRMRWAELHGQTSRAYVKDIDAKLHSERVDRQRAKRTHSLPIDALPDGVFVLWHQIPHVVLADMLYPWRPKGYGTPVARPANQLVQVLTPPSLVGVIAIQGSPQIDPSAG